MWTLSQTGICFCSWSLFGVTPAGGLWQASVTAADTSCCSLYIAARAGGQSIRAHSPDAESTRCFLTGSYRYKEVVFVLLSHKEQNEQAKDCQTRGQVSDRQGALKIFRKTEKINWRKKNKELKIHLLKQKGNTQMTPLWYWNFVCLNSQPAQALWFDRKKYVTINFVVQRPKDVQVDIQSDKMILWWV